MYYLMLILFNCCLFNETFSSSDYRLLCGNNRVIMSGKDVNKISAL
jgi:hypothetical protein